MPYVIRKYGKYLDITIYEKETKSKKGVRVLREKPDNGIGQRRADSLKRTRKIFLRRVLSAIEKFGCPLLITLTFAGKASDAFYAGECLAKFGRRLRVEYPNCSYVFIPEISPGGRIHFHGLLFGVSSDSGDSYKGRQLISVGSERKTRKLAELWGNGFVDVRQTDASPKLVFYLAKYITKGSGEVVLNGMRLLRFSKNFPHEITIRDSYICGRIVSRLESRKLVSEWSVDSIFLGRITKSLYVDNPA